MAHCTYGSTPKGPSWAEATSNNENIKHVVLAIIKIEGSRQAVS